MSIDDLVENKTIYPTIVVPQGEDKSVGHAVCVVDDFIFDSTQKYVMKLTKESLDWICGEKGCFGIYFALRFDTKYGTAGKYKRKLELHF